MRDHRSKTVRPAPGSIIDRRTLNRTLLARQGLLTRAGFDVAETLEHLVGMQAQVPRDPYIGLWARLEDFDPATLENLLLERRAVRMTLMRSTLHLATSSDAWLLRAATQRVTERGFASSPFRRRVSGIELDLLRDAGTASLEERPLSMPELGSELAARWPAVDGEALAYAVRYLVPVVQVPPRGLLSRTAAPRLTTLRSWLAVSPVGPDDPPVTGWTPEAATDKVVERYLRAFGPATASDIRRWSGMGSLRDAVARLGPRLRRYSDGAGRELLDVDDGLFASPRETAPVRFLGEYDNVFLGHADRSRITGDLSWGAGWVRRGAFFVDGILAGAWRSPVDGDAARIDLEAKRRLDDVERRDVATEAEALIRLLAGPASRQRVAWAG